MGLWSWLKTRLSKQKTEPTGGTLAGKLLAAARAGSTATAPPVAPADAPVRESYGVTSSDPVLCNQPAGERAYIASLRCPQGHRLGGSRLGSMEGKCTDPRHHASLFPSPGENPADACIVDRYDLRCEGGEFSCTLYFDMYHPEAPPQPAPRGMTRA